MALARMTYNASDRQNNRFYRYNQHNNRYNRYNQHSTPPGEGGGCSGFQVTGIIKWGQKSKPKIIPKAFNKTPKKFPEQRLTPQKSHAEFPSLNNFQKALNDITQKVKLSSLVVLYSQNYAARIRGH